MKLKNIVLVPFYRGAVVFKSTDKILSSFIKVLVPFYRGAVVFKRMKIKCLIF